MPQSLSAVAVVAVALLPGALYVWGFEREAGRWGVGRVDRLLRFVGGSAVLHALVAPATFWAWSTFVRSGRLADGDVPLASWAVVLAYVLGPLAAGVVVGRAFCRGARWPRVLVGAHPAPRAWDHLFASSPVGWVRVRLKSGRWVGGLYGTVGGRHSYVAGYPEPEDIGHLPRPQSGRRPINGGVRAREWRYPNAGAGRAHPVERSRRARLRRRPRPARR